MKKAIFFDRDGTLNRVLENGTTPCKSDDFVLYSGVEQLLSRFREDGFLNIVVTNQPDIGRGRLEGGELEKIHEILRDLPIDDIFVCPHIDEDNCECRKPKPGLLIQAASKWSISLENSFMVGDTWRDVGAGKNAGCHAVLLIRPQTRFKAKRRGILPNHVVYDYEGLYRYISRRNGTYNLKYR